MYRGGGKLPVIWGSAFEQTLTKPQKEKYLCLYFQAKKTSHSASQICVKKIALE